MKGLGLDLCEISRMEKLIENEGFLRRYYTQEEAEYISTRGKGAAQSAAAMFAAKEAFLKALRVGLVGDIVLSEVGVTHSEDGAPSYALTGKAKEALDAIGAQAFLSLTHEAGVAAAVCILE